MPIIIFEKFFLLIYKNLQTMENRIFSNTNLLIAAFALFFLASFTFKKELATPQDSPVTLKMLDNENNCCCPKGWSVTQLIPEELLGHPDGGDG